MVCILAADGTAIREDEVMKLAGTTEANGTDPSGVYKVLKHFKIPHRAGQMTPQQLRDAIWAGHPVLLMLQAYRDNPKTPYNDCWDDGHGVVCIGYDSKSFTFEDPASYTRTWLSEHELLLRWHDTDAKGKRLINWGCEILRKPHFQPGKSVHME